MFKFFELHLMPSAHSSHWHTVITVYCYHSIDDWNGVWYVVWIRVLTAEDFLVGWNIKLANEYSELDAWVREWAQKLFIYFEATVKSRRPQKGELRLRSLSTQVSDMCWLWCVDSYYEKGGGYQKCYSNCVFIMSTSSSSRILVKECFICYHILWINKCYHMPLLGMEVLHM